MVIIEGSERPETFLLENVQNLVTYNNGKVIKKILKLLRKNYYVPEPQILDAKDFGLAQKRTRIFIVGFLNKNTDTKPINGEGAYKKQVSNFFLKFKKMRPKKEKKIKEK